MQSSGKPVNKTGAQATSDEKKNVVEVKVPQVEEDNSAPDVVEGVVYELTADDMPNILQREPNVVIMIYAEWCGYCKKMAPEFAVAAQNYHGCTWGRINSEKFPQVAKALNVESFPTTIQFVNGEAVKVLPGAMDSGQLINAVASSTAAK